MMKSIEGMWGAQCLSFIDDVREAQIMKKSGRTSSGLGIVFTCTTLWEVMRIT